MTLQKTLRYLIYTGIFALLALPFLAINDLYFPFISAKAYYFRIIVEIIFVAWVCLALFEPAVRPKKSWVMLSLSLFMVVLLLANVQGINPMHSFWSNFERMEGYITFLHLFALFFVLGGIMQHEKLWTRFFNTAVVVSVAQAGYAVLQATGVLAVGLSQDRIDGTMGNATYLAIYMIFSLFLTLLLYFKHEGPQWIRHWYIFAMAMQVIAIFLTATRGAILALVGGVVLTFLLLAFWQPQKRTLRKVAGGVLLVAVLFAVLVTVFKDTALVQNVNGLKRVASISLTERTVEARFVNWGIAWEAIKERPLLGYGQGNYMPVFDAFYDPQMWNQENWFDRVHNIVFDWLINAGFVGFISYALLFGVILYYLWRPGARFSIIEQSIITGLLAAYVFHNLFVFDNLVSYFYFVVVLAYVHARNSVSFGERCERELQQTVAMPLAIVLLLLVLPYTVWAINADSMRQNLALIDGLRVRSADQLVDAKAYFIKALAYDAHGDLETRQQIIQYTNMLLRSESISLEAKQDFVNFTGTVLQDGLDRYTDDARYLVVSAQLVGSIGNVDLALQLFEQAISFAPKKQFLYWPVVEILFDQEKKEEALAVATQAYRIYPENDTAWKHYVKALLRAGHTEEYKAMIAEAFAAEKGYRVVNLTEENLVRDPENAQSYASLAVAYYENGDAEKAIVVLRQMIEKFPNAEAQATAIIQKIEAGESLTQ